MSGKIAIVTDTGCSLSKEHLSRDTFVVPFYINFQDMSYKDLIDIDPETVYKKMETEIPKTSIPSPGDIKEKLEHISALGYDKILIITISSNLSSFYSSCSVVADNGIEGLEIKVIDSKNIAFGSGFLVLYAQKLIDENPDIDFENLYNRISAFIPKSRVFFTLDTLKYLVLGGRIGKVTAGIGTMLNIKPIISCDENGIYYTVKKTRGSEKAISEIINIVKKALNGKKNYFLALIYKNDKNFLQKIESQISSEIKNAAAYIALNFVTPSLGVHTGASLSGIGYMILD